MSRKKDTRGPRKNPRTNKMSTTLSHLIRKLFEKNSDSKLTHKQVCTLLDLRENELRKLAFSVLQEMVQAGQLKSVSHGVYEVNSTFTYLEGNIELTSRGAGFVILDGDDKDVYIDPKNINRAMHGDRVKIQIIKSGKSRVEGEVVDIIERERTQFVGTLHMHEKFAFLVPDNQRLNTDIYIPKEKLNGAKDGEKVMVKITIWPKSADSPYGEVIERLGSRTPNDAEMIGILCNNGIDHVFTQEVIAESEHVTMDLDNAEIAKRRDMRDVLTFTIDPADAKDFDDALSFQRLPNGTIEVGIHIADVSHYVKPGMAMDAEALKRSNSVYLVDRVVPMLPEQLSNMACSLRPNEDKYTFSAIFDMDENGKILKEWFGKTVIHSNKRYAYEDAQEVIEGKEDEFKDEILLLDKIAKTYRAARLKKGALSIESEEMRFELDEHGHPINVIIKTSKDAHKLIEEFMLLANKKVAEFLGKPKQGRDPFPSIYRVHDKPDMGKVELFKVFIDKFGYELESSDQASVSKSINALLDDIRYKNEYSLIQTMAIRSMSKATYETKNIGHYGLAFEHYTHFTSPIRRYADLIVHRILQEELTAKKHVYGSSLDDVCKHISRMERKAVDAERESTKYFQTMFVIDKIGETFEGTVSGIAEFGIFVRMDENQCEGMVPMNQIPGDRFSFDAEKFRIAGAKTKKEYNFGDKVTVRIFEVHPRKRQIDLEIVD